MSGLESPDPDLWISWDDGPDFGMFQPIKEDDEVTVTFSRKNGWGV
jgi:hypothetical protein